MCTKTINLQPASLKYPPWIQIPDICPMREGFVKNQITQEHITFQESDEGQVALVSFKDRQAGIHLIGMPEERKKSSFSFQWHVSNFLFFSGIL
jgi:hypothetical protein